jgi:FkbM family methyltransferase
MYSQNDEEAVIERWTPTKGRFLDIGAWRARELSNTRALYERGWSGVLVEPSPGPMRALVEEYGGDPQIDLVSAAVGPERGLLHMHITDLPVSTADKEVREVWKDEGGYIGKLWVPIWTVEDLINQFGPFDFVSIDAEGGSVDIFRRVVVNPMHAVCICVEHDGKSQECLQIAQAAGYSRFHQTSENLVFSR